MSLTISSITLEFFWGRYAYFSGGGRDAFIKFSTGLPFLLFSRERQGATLELWGLGVLVITNPS